MKINSGSRRPSRAAVKSATAASYTNGDTAPVQLRKPRGRPRSFDRAAALESAIEVFWTKGYEATSISDLTAAMGINPPSLYAAFGDKERLFLEAVRRYEALQGDSCPYCEEPTARGAFEKLLTYLAEELTSSSHPRGCMLMMAATTANSASPEMQKALAKRRAESRAGMRARIERGIADGDVPRGTDAAALSDFYVTIASGMALQAREGATRKSLLGTVERAMSLFPPVAGSAARKEASGRKK
jgi:TetR/AcrR family transcriptional regulator, copper-responsive repressor